MSNNPTFDAPPTFAEITAGPHVSPAPGLPGSPVMPPSQGMPTSPSDFYNSTDRAFAPPAMPLPISGAKP